MPPALLFAVILALMLGLPREWQLVRFPDLTTRVGSVGIGAVIIGLFATVLGRLISHRIDRIGHADRRAFRQLRAANRLITMLSLSYFATVLISADWADLVDRGLKLHSIPIIEEIAIISPFLAAQLLGRIGLFGAERRLRDDAFDLGLLRAIGRSTRRAAGFLLPVVLIYLPSRQNLLSPLSVTDSEMLPTFLGMCGMSVLVFSLSPLFMRLAWPMTSLPSGHLRNRLEFISKRLEFRCTDILVWNAGDSVVNAGVTGPLPWFRFVLISKAMIENLATPGIEAVFGHEVGHYRLRHLPFYAFFFVATAAISSLGLSAIETHSSAEAKLERWIGNPILAGVAVAVLTLAVLGAVIYFGFGALSRRFEREADLFGARVVSCGSAECMPHIDLNDPRLGDQSTLALCPTGAALMGDALREVADCNHFETTTKDWRHGSIATRIEFLRTLEDDPALVRLFEVGTRRLKRAVFGGMIITILVFWAISQVGY